MPCACPRAVIIDLITFDEDTQDGCVEIVVGEFVFVVLHAPNMIRILNLSKTFAGESLRDTFVHCSHLLPLGKMHPLR